VPTIPRFLTRRDTRGSLSVGIHLSTKNRRLFVGTSWYDGRLCAGRRQAWLEDTANGPSTAEPASCLARCPVLLVLPRSGPPRPRVYSHQSNDNVLARLTCISIKLLLRHRFVAL